MPETPSLDHGFGRACDRYPFCNVAMPDHTGRLLLTPRDPFLAPDPKVVCAALAACGFIGDPLPGRAGAFRVGQHFLALVVFAGCSVQVVLSPSANPSTPFCHIRMDGPYGGPCFVSGRNTRPPRCPSCRAPLREWRRVLEAGDTGAMSCPACHGSTPPWEWDWKQNAGYGRLFVQVEEVFPGEAEPAPALMGSLADASAGAAWRHFFVQDP